MGAHLEWTTERPKSPGYYWTNNGYISQIAFVYRDGDGEMLVSTLTPPVGESTVALSETRADLLWSLIAEDAPDPGSSRPT